MDAETQCPASAESSRPALADALRVAMVDELRELGAIRSGRVASAVRVVPRHLFAPAEPLERAYAANSAVVIKRDTRGAAISSLSAAHIQATMLEQAQFEPGMRVLEIGSAATTRRCSPNWSARRGRLPRSM